MTRGCIRIVSIILYSIILLAGPACTRVDTNERHILVSMRMIGHSILHNSGDSSSRVLPVKKEADRYKIQFESEFQFIPEKLAATIDSVVKKTGLAKSYIAEVEECKTGELVYSFEIRNPSGADIVPCGSRTMGRACYNIYITILDAGESSLTAGLYAGFVQVNYLLVFLLLTIALILTGTFLYVKKKTQKPLIKPADPNIIAIGGYLFDRTNSKLLADNQSVELSSRESELLFLLYNAANTTVERDVILKNIWKDEGDYIGRTLDVFISRLRKKLESEPGVKIVNVRGVGYKLVLNGHNQVC